MRQRIRKAILAFTALLFPFIFIFFSPYLIIMGAASGVINASPVMFGLMFIGSLVFGRLFCGWLCPGGAIQDAVAQANGRSWNTSWANLSKFLIWGVWLTAIIVLWIRNAPLTLDFFYQTDLEPHLIIIYFTVVTFIYLFALLTGKRGMCHSFCWMAPFMIIGESLSDALHIPRYRLLAHSDKCISCSRCNRQCPMGIDIQSKIEKGQADDHECILCLACVDTCPQKAIKSGFQRRSEQ